MKQDLGPQQVPWSLFLAACTNAHTLSLLPQKAAELPLLLYGRRREVLPYQLPPFPSSPSAEAAITSLLWAERRTEDVWPFGLHLLFKLLFPVSSKESEAEGMEKSQKLDLAVGLSRFRKLGK